MQVIKGAPKGGGDQVEGLFDRARQSGARQGTSADLPGGGKTGSSNPNAFSGTARTLQGGEAEPSPSTATPAPASQGPHEHVITFWRNNIFTVNDGERLAGVKRHRTHDMQVVWQLKPDHLFASRPVLAMDRNAACPAHATRVPRLAAAQASHAASPPPRTESFWMRW